MDVACDPAPGSSFPVGTTTVTCTATDHVGNTDTGTFTVTVTQQTSAPTGMALRAPVDPAPVMNLATRGRSVPVRLTLTNPDTTRWTPVSVGVPEPVACTVASRIDAVEWYVAHATAETNLFTWDRRRGDWLYRFDTRALTRNLCYRVPVEYGGTVRQRMASGGTEIGAFFIRAR